MQKVRAISVVLVIVFSLLLTGNMLGYILCQRAITQETSITDCGCDDLLKAFDGESGPGGDLKAPLKIVSLESVPSSVSEAGIGISISITGYHALYQFFMPQRNSDAVFHPPAA